MNRDVERSADRPLGVGLVLLLLLAAFGQGGAEPGVLLAWHLLLGALVIFALLVSGARGSVGFGVGRLAWLAGLPWIGVVLVGAWFSPYAFAAWLFVLELAAFLAVVGLAGRVGPQLKHRLVMPLLLLAGAEGLFALSQRWLLGAARPAGTFLNPNHLAGWIVVVLLLVAGETLRAGKSTRAGILLRGLVAVPALAALGVIASRGALLALAAGAAVLVWIHRGRLARRTRFVGATILLLLIVLAGFAQWQRLREPDPFRYTRLQIWRSSIQAVLDAPWTGSGPRQFAAASRNLQFPDDNGPLRYDRSFSFPHSDWLRAPCELGWPGVLALICAAGGLGVGLRRRLRAGPGAGDAAGALAALAAILTQATVDHVTQRPAIYLLGAALLGSLLAARESVRQPAPQATRLAVALLLALVLIVGDVAPYRAWRSAEGVPEEGPLSPDEIARLERSARLNTLHPDYPMRLAVVRVAEGSRFGVEEYAAAREAAEQALRLQPVAARYRRGMARVEARACRSLFGDVATRERAQDAYREAESLARFDPFVPLELAMFLIDVGDPAGGRRAAERALSLEPESVLPRLVLADALLAEGAAGSGQRAEALVREARDKAQRWSSWVERSEYASELLSLDPAALERIRRRLDDETR